MVELVSRIWHFYQFGHADHDSINFYLECTRSLCGRIFKFISPANLSSNYVLLITILSLYFQVVKQFKQDDAFKMNYKHLLIYKLINIEL